MAPEIENQSQSGTSENTESEITTVAPEDHLQCAPPTSTWEDTEKQTEGSNAINDTPVTTAVNGVFEDVQEVKQSDPDKEPSPHKHEEEEEKHSPPPSPQPNELPDERLSPTDPPNGKELESVSVKSKESKRDDQKNKPVIRRGMSSSSWRVDCVL